MRKKSNTKAATYKTEQYLWRKWWPHLLCAIVGGLGAMLIHWFIKKGFPLIWTFWPVLLAFIGGFVVATITWFYVAKRQPDLNKKMLSLFALLALTTVSISGSIFAIRHLTNGTGSTEIRVLKKWDSEDGTTQGWGVYDEPRGTVVKSPDIAAESLEFADGTWCLRVDNIDIKTESDTGRVAFKKRLAVRYEGDVSLTNAKLVASIYVPADLAFDYADAKFFVFAGANWEWHESETADQGVLLEPGKWVDVSWDLRHEETRQWPSPWPWRNILGIQIYVEGTFKGPVYIDNVTITVTK